MTRSVISRVTRAALAALAFAGAACVAEETAPADFTRTDEPAAPSPTEGVVVADVVTADGARLIFVDDGADGEPSIGVEILSSTTTPATDAMLAEEPSALELFLAAVPDKVAPRALVRDHELLAASGAVAPEPRRLTIARAVGESVQPYDCADTAGWQADFAGWAPVLDGQYIKTYESGYTTGYVGNAYKFYFDVCRPWDVYPSTTYFTGVQRRINPDYAWVTISDNTDALDYQQRRWRYYRNTFTCSSYQYRLVVSSGSNYYHRAARWSDQWSCSISSSQ